MGIDDDDGKWKEPLTPKERSIRRQHLQKEHKRIMQQLRKQADKDTMEILGINAQLEEVSQRLIEKNDKANQQASEQIRDLKN